jgi:hypothetical protein
VNKTPITIHCVIEPKTQPYADRMQANALLLADEPSLLSFRYYPSGPRGSSWGHGEGLALAMQATKDAVGDIHVIADADTQQLAKGWDSWLRLMLLHGDEDERDECPLPTAHVIGVTYEDRGGFSSGRTNVQTYKKLPNMTWFAFRGDTAPWWEFDPQRSETTLPITQENAYVYCLQPYDELLRDVGWRLPSFCVEHDLIARGLERERKAMQGLREYHEEWWLSNVMGIAHQRGSSKHAFMSETMSKPFYDAVDAWLAREAT